MKHLTTNRLILLAMIMAATCAKAQPKEYQEQGDARIYSAETQQKSTEGRIQAEVSETVELMSILSRTAQFREYCMDLGGTYTQETEQWFSPFTNHPTVAYFQELRANYGISYDAVMSMAINLAIDGNEVKILTDKNGLERRWGEVDIDTFLVKLNQFYTDTHFHDFYSQHRSFYESVLRTYEQNVMQYFHQDWYQRFYGTAPTEQFRVVIGFTNGGGNYGPSRQLPGMPKEVFAICGYHVDQQTGKAFENGLDYASTLIHEFNHSFVNPLFETNATQLEPIGEKLLKLSYRGMYSQAYRNSITIINESIVRAAVIIYMEENGFTAEQVKAEMYDQIGCAFQWMPELVTALHDYAKHRKRYNTLADYYPEIVKCLSKYLKKEKERIEHPL